MAHLYLALFSLLFCHSFYLNAAEQKLSTDHKIRPKRNYDHQRNNYQRNGSRDDLYIATKNPSRETKRHSVSGPLNPIVKTPETGNEFYPKAFSDGSVNQKSKKKLGLSPFKTRNKKNFDPVTPLAPIEEKPEHGFLTGTRDLRIDLVKFYLSSNSFNPNKPRDQFGNTAFHIIAAQKTKLYSSTEENVEEKMRTATAIIDIFLKDYRTDFSIINNVGSTPRELLSSNKDILLRPIFFSRCSLNTFVNKYAGKFKNAYLRGSISLEVIEGVAQQIVGELKDIEASQQKDRALPSESRFPTYATIYFIEQMLLARLEYITNDN